MAERVAGQSVGASASCFGRPPTRFRVISQCSLTSRVAANVMANHLCQWDEKNSGKDARQIILFLKRGSLPLPERRQLVYGNRQHLDVLAHRNSHWRQSL